MLALELGHRPAIGRERWPCAVCGGNRTPEGYDPCWGYLPGVLFACCGHDSVDPRSRYISTVNGRRFGGFQALQKYNQWVHSTEGRLAIEVDRLGLTKAFGWTLPTLSRSRCTAHFMPSYECRHRYPPERLDS